MSTRIVLVNYQDKSGKAHLLGFLAEHATETMRRSEEDFADSGVTVADLPISDLWHQRITPSGKWVNVLIETDHPADIMSAGVKIASISRVFAERTLGHSVLRN